VGDKMNIEIKELFDIDLQFCLESQKEGFKAWNKFLSEHIIFGGDPEDSYISGKKKIIESLEKFYQLKNLVFTWKPKHAFISDDRTLGVTTGFYERTYLSNGKIINRKGKYTTTWKRIDGAWKIIFDIGN
jgi:hypothetical protein